MKEGEDRTIDVRRERKWPAENEDEGSSIGKDLSIKTISEDWLENVRVFNNILRDPDKVRETSELTQEENPEVHEYQKKLTSMVLRSFPGITKLLREEDLQFHVRILKIPFFRTSNNMQHDCIQKYLVENQGGLMNIAMGINRIFSDTYFVDLPVFAPEKKGEELLFKQRKLLESSLPPLQQGCLIKAQPICMADRVYDYRGRWLVWRLLFDLDTSEKLAKTSGDVTPLYTQRLASLKLSSLFPFAGTTDGELSLIIFDESEVDRFKDNIRGLEKDFDLRTGFIDTHVKASWESIVELGVLPYAAEPHIPKMGKIFTRKLKSMIIEDTMMDFGSIIEKDNVSEQKIEEERIRGLSDSMVFSIMHRTMESVLHIVQRVPESLMKRFEIRGRRV